MPRTRTDRDGVWLDRRRESAFWQICWYDAARRKVRRRSTRTTDRTEAERVRAEFVLGQDREADPPAQSAGPLQLPARRVTEILDQYWDEHARHLPSAVQAEAARKHLTGFFGDAVVTTLTVNRQEAYVTARHNHGIKPSTISRELSVLRAAVHHVGLGAAIRVYDVGESASRGRWLTPEEFQQLLQACRSPHTRLYMLLGIATAGRPEAILDLKWSQVDLVSGVIHLNPQGRIQTSKRRPTVRIDLPLLEALRQAKATARTDWVIEYHGYAINSIKTAFRDAAATAGFPPGDVTPYVLRHTAATWMAQDGVPLWTIAGFLGHSDIRMVERHYAHHHPDYQKSAAQALGRRLAELDLAPQLHPTRGKDGQAASAKSLKRMVGVTGIEPVTPTMST
jgi:integrase